MECVALAVALIEAVVGRLYPRRPVGPKGAPGAVETIADDQKGAIQRGRSAGSNRDPGSSIASSRA